MYVVGAFGGNQQPGFVGDVAVLKSDPSQRWICVANHAAGATWQIG